MSHILDRKTPKSQNNICNRMHLKMLSSLSRSIYHRGQGGWGGGHKLDHPAHFEFNLNNPLWSMEINEKQWLWRKMKFFSYIHNFRQPWWDFFTNQARKSFLHPRISPNDATMLHKCRNSCVFHHKMISLCGIRCPIRICNPIYPNTHKTVMLLYLLIAPHVIIITSSKWLI